MVAREIISRLNLEVIRSYPVRYGTNVGKFIRIGGLVVVGPFNKTNPDFRVSHGLLLREMQDDPELSEAATAQLREAELRNATLLRDQYVVNEPPVPVEDAGQFDCTPRADLGSDEAMLLGSRLQRPEVSEIVWITRASASYGAGDEAARTQTGKVFEESLGNTALVMAGML